MAVLALVLLGFVLGEHYRIQPGTVAVSGAALLLTGLGQDRRGQAEQVREALLDVAWNALFFFIGLFVIAHGVQATGLLDQLAEGLMGLTGGNGSLIGAAANVMVAGLSERAGTPIGFARVLAIGMPVMVVSVAVANLYIYLRHFV